MLRFILTLSLVASTLWFISTPGYDSFIAILTAIIALVTTEIKKPNSIAIPKPSSSISEKSDEKNTFPSKAEVKTNEVFNLVEKLIYALNAHDIHSNEIPRFMPEEFGITLADLSSKENLLKKITPQVIDWICVTFGIKREWFETDSDVIYETENFYKNEAALLRLMKKLKKTHNHDLNVFALKCVKKLDCNGGRDQDVNLLISYPIAKIGEKTIYRYIPTSTHWDWGYWRTRYQFKGITRVCYTKLSQTFNGYDLTRDNMIKLSSGIVFPKEILDKIPLSLTWYPDDYVDTEKASVCAKETHETQEIYQYIQNQRYISFIEENV